MSAPDSLALAALDALPTQVAILDDDGEIRYTNAAWREFGADNGFAGDPATLGVNYLDVCDASDDESAAEAARGIRSVLSGDREAFSFEYPCHAPDEERWFTMRVASFRHGDDPYALVFHLDITDRKRVERETETNAERLRNVAGLLSHDLRNPLAVASGYAEMLAADAESDERADRVLAALERMDDIVTDALVLARNDAVESVRIVDLRTQAETAWSNVATADATLDVPDTASFYANPTLLAHVFENLFRNAIDHGGGTVTVTVGLLPEAETARGGFYVEDDGPGIPDEIRDSAFDAGYTTSEAGTGLGLAIVSQISAAHDWDVAATDAPGGGARFEVSGVELAA